MPRCWPLPNRPGPSWHASSCDSSGIWIRTELWPGRRTWGDARRPGGWDLRQDEHALVFGRGVFGCLVRIVVRELRSGIVSGRSVAGGLSGQRFGLVVALSATREHLHGRGHDLSLPMALAPVVFPLAGLQPAFDGHLLALAKVLAADLREAVPDHDVVVFGPLLAVAAVFVGGHCERRDVRSAGQRPEFRIASQPAGQKDLVHGPGLL